MAKGLDANVDLTTHAACIKGAGYEFVGRYYKFAAGSHPLHHAEAVSLSRAGLYIVVVYENGSPTSATYFSRARGLWDGEHAYSYALHSIGQPPSSPIYFAVDYDASAAEIDGPIRDYFHGISDGFNQSGGGHPIYPIGVYGSGMTCARLVRATNVTYTWLSQSRGWRGYRTFQGWNLRQGDAAHVCGASVDLDESKGHGGGFRLT